MNLIKLVCTLMIAGAAAACAQNEPAEPPAPEDAPEAVEPVEAAQPEAASAPEPALTEAEALERAKSYAAMALNGPVDEVWNRFSPEFREAVGGKEQFVAMRDQMSDQLGAEVEVRQEAIEWVEQNQMWGYRRVSTFSNVDNPVATMLAISADGETILGLSVRPAQ